MTWHILLMNFRSSFDELQQIFSAWSFKHLISLSWWGLLESPKKIKKNSNIFWGETQEKFFNRRGSRRPIGDDMKVRRGELTNIRSTQKHESGRVKRYQKAEWHVSLVIKEFLMIKNGSQYTYYKKNNLIMFTRAYNFKINKITRSLIIY